MKFEFPFEKLLEHKRNLEKEALRHYNEAQSKVDQATAKLNEMYEQIDQSRTRAGSLGAVGGTAIPELGLIDSFINGQKVRIESQRRVIRELAVEAQSRHGILVEAARERKTLEKLREKRLEDFKKLAKKRELKEIDELVVTRFKASGDDQV